MKHIFACGCGENTECQDRDLAFGAVFECRHCSQVWGRVRPRGGGTAWVKISDQEVDFYDLLGRQYDGETA
jgi:hypothetical protein